jgi:hypothetical protein
VRRRYTSRTERHDTPSGVLTRRDVRLLAAVWRMRAITVSVVEELFGVSRPRASARLRAIFDRRLVDAHVPRMDGETWFTLTGAGARLLAARLPEVAGDARATSLPRSLAHHALVGGRPLHGRPLGGLIVVGSEPGRLRRLARVLVAAGLGDRALVAIESALRGNMFTGGFATAAAYAATGEDAIRVGLDAVLTPEKQVLGVAERNVSEIAGVRR